MAVSDKAAGGYSVPLPAFQHLLSPRSQINKNRELCTDQSATADGPAAARQWPGTTAGGAWKQGPAWCDRQSVDMNQSACG